MKKDIGLKVWHKGLGFVWITEDCIRMQQMNPDPTSVFILHDGDIKEVSRNMLSF